MYQRIGYTVKENIAVNTIIQRIILCLLGILLAKPGLSQQRMVEPSRNSAVPIENVVRVNPSSAHFAGGPQPAVMQIQLPSQTSPGNQTLPENAVTSHTNMQHAYGQQQSMGVEQVSPAGFRHHFRQRRAEVLPTPSVYMTAGSDSPAPVYSPIPPQSQGLTSGACLPCINGIDCADSCGEEQKWKNARSIEFQPLLHGEYIGPVRLAAMAEYRVRVGDQIRFTYLFTREEDPRGIRLQVGDEIRLTSVGDPSINQGTLERGVQIQEDGNVHLELVGPLRAVGMSTDQLQKSAEKAYSAFIKNPAINIQPVKYNTRLQDLRDAVDSRFGQGGLTRLQIVAPDGRINLPKIGSVYIHGMTLEEIKQEINLRYQEKIFGVELEMNVEQFAQHFVYVLGEVAQPGRFEIPQPITVSQALALAGGMNVGSNHRQVVVFRRAEDWRLVSTMLDLRGAHLGRSPDPSDQIWIRDNDLIIVPPMPIRLFDNFVQQVFTQGIYGVVPFGGISVNFGDGAGI